MVFYVIIWTWMASNNIIPLSANYDLIPGYWPISAVNKYPSVLQIHHVHVSTPRWSMSIFLIKSNGGTPQNISLNVFIILVWSIYCENNIWHEKYSRFTLALELVSQTAPYVPRREFGCFQLRLSRLIYARSARSDRSRNRHDPYTARDTACWWANLQDLYARS